MFSVPITENPPVVVNWQEHLGAHVPDAFSDDEYR